MPVWLPVTMVGAGFVMLYVAAEAVVRGATRLARVLGIGSIVVGLTVVAFGTSAPELVVSGLASWRDRGGLAVGNVIGSNVVNIAVILAIAALISPLRVEYRFVAREIPVMIGVTLLLILFIASGTVVRWEGGILLAVLAAYLGLIFRESSAAGLPPEVARAVDAAGPAPRPAVALAMLVLGIAGLVLGAHLLVSGATQLALGFGLAEEVIGLTIVAIGTSLPELATCIVAAARREPDIVLGNVVGSNIFNALAIIGVAAVIRPLDITPGLLRFEVPAMVVASIVLLPLAITRMRLGRREGAGLLIGYVIFAWILLSRAPGLAAVAGG